TSPVLCRNQRTRCQGALFVSSGSSRRLYSQPFSQRGASLHPLGDSSDDGTFLRMDHKSLCSSSRLGTYLRSPSVYVCAGCSDRRHFSQAFTQRGANLHPLCHSSGDGTFPRMEYKRFCSSSRLGTDLRSPSVYGCAGCSNRRKTSASSTTRPAYITTTRSAIS